MKKIIIITGNYGLKSYVRLSLFKCHIDWLRGRGINLDCTHEAETVVYSKWAEKNRTNPLLVECLELHKDTVAAGIRGALSRQRAAEQWSLDIGNAMRRFARGITRPSGHGHLSVKEVRASFDSQYTLEEILDKYSGSFKPKDMEASKRHFADIQNCQQSMEAAYQELDDYCASSGIGQVGFYHNPDFEVVEYDEKKFKPVLNVEFEGIFGYNEKLRLKPLDIETGPQVTEAALKYFFEGGDDGFQSLVAYLRNRNVTVV